MMSSLLIVVLCAHGSQSQSRDAIGASAAAFDQAAPLQFPEEVHRAIGEAIAIAIPAIDFDDPAVISDVLDASALCKTVQHALFEFRDIQGRCLSTH
jgi:hypothetical protein